MRACAANCAAVSADTWSAAAAATPVVGAVAAAFPGLIAEPMLCKLPAAAASISCSTVTNDMDFSFRETDRPGHGARPGWCQGMRQHTPAMDRVAPPFRLSESTRVLIT